MASAKALLLVDPQVDFITGTLPVPGALFAMNNLADWLQKNNGVYAVKIITLDFHPYNHFSFIEYGGKWPRHCVNWSEGAAIWPKLMPALYETFGTVHVFCKGTNPTVEEYSIFQNEKAIRQLEHILDKIELINICGLAGDICVLTTLKDAIRLLKNKCLIVMKEFSPSIDGGNALEEFQKERF